MQLFGDLVVLRPARRDDAEVIARGFVDDPTMGAMLGMDPEEETAEFLAGTFPEDGSDEGDGDSHWFVITLPENGETVGEIGLVDISQPNRRASISILVLPGARRSGLGRAAIELLVNWAHTDSRTAPDRDPHAARERADERPRAGRGLRARGRSTRLQRRERPPRR